MEKMNQYVVVGSNGWLFAYSKELFEIGDNVVVDHKTRFDGVKTFCGKVTQYREVDVEGGKVVGVSSDLCFSDIGTVAMRKAEDSEMEKIARWEEDEKAEFEAERVIAIAAQLQKNKRYSQCPRCGSSMMCTDYLFQNALSRRMDIYICDRCGVLEALEDMPGMKKLPLRKWYVVSGVKLQDE